MGLFLLRFWPALLPLLVYWLWLYNVGRRATIEGKPVMRFRDGPWYWMVLSSLLIGIGCFILMGMSVQGQKGNYVPPHLKNGELVPGQVSRQ